MHAQGPDPYPLRASYAPPTPCPVLTSRACDHDALLSGPLAAAAPNRDGQRGRPGLVAPLHHGPRPVRPRGGSWLAQGPLTPPTCSRAHVLTCQRDPRPPTPVTLQRSTVTRARSQG
eukprot:3811231-Rhodomonas_salina.1